MRLPGHPGAASTIPTILVTRVSLPGAIAACQLCRDLVLEQEESASSQRNQEHR
jgi:hypothetical protein